jgi:hypothetical protein
MSAEARAPAKQLAPLIFYGWSVVIRVDHICYHTFRATGITAYQKNGGALEHAQAIAARESPRTTKLCDRTRDGITLDENDRIVI